MQSLQVSTRHRCITCHSTRWLILWDRLTLENLSCHTDLQKFICVSSDIFVWDSPYTYFQYLRIHVKWWEWEIIFSWFRDISKIKGRSQWQRSNAWVFGSSLAGIAVSNPAGGMDVWVVWVLCVVRFLLCRADHLSRESCRVWCVWVWSWSFDKEEVLAH